MSDTSSPPEQLQHTEELPDLILEAVKYHRDNGADAVNSQDVVRYIEDSCHIGCDHNQINLVLEELAGEGGPLAQLKEGDVIKFQCTIDPKGRPQLSERNLRPSPQETTSSPPGDTDHSTELAKTASSELPEENLKNLSVPPQEDDVNRSESTEEPADELPEGNSRRPLPPQERVPPPDGDLSHSEPDKQGKDTQNSDLAGQEGNEPVPAGGAPFPFSLIPFFGSNDSSETQNGGKEIQCPVQKSPSQDSNKTPKRGDSKEAVDSGLRD